MPIARLIILLLLLLGVTLLALQNWSPALPLVFWGMETQPLPLGVWIAIAIVAGALTSLFISGLLQLADALSPTAPSRNSTTEQATAARTAVQSTPQTRIQTPDYEAASAAQFTTTSPPETDDFSAAAQAAAAYPPEDRSSRWQPDSNNAPFTQNQSVEPAPDESDWSDWDEAFESTKEDADWSDWDEDPEPTDRPPTPQAVDRTANTYERQQTPRASSRSGSTYSYSYQDSSKSGASNRESVYDAEYRVIIPPYRPLDSDEAFEEEEFEEKEFETNDDGF